MDALAAARFLLDVTDRDGSELERGKRFRLPNPCTVFMASSEGETSLEFSPPAKAGQEFLRIAVLTKWVDCPRIVFGKTSMRVELIGRDAVVVPYGG